MIKELGLAAFAVAALYLGCADEETEPPRRVSDAGTSTATPTGDSGTTTPDTGTSTPDAAGSTDTGAAADVATTSPCVAYCECMSATCAGKIADCPATCAARPGTWDLGCRTQHCGLAKASDTVLHCGHANGEALCP